MHIITPRYYAMDCPSFGVKKCRGKNSTHDGKDLPCTAPFLNDIIVGSTGHSVEEIISNPTQDLKAGFADFGHT